LALALGSELDFRHFCKIPALGNRFGWLRLVGCKARVNALCIALSTGPAPGATSRQRAQSS
jgi:hypothetical protein